MTAPERIWAMRYYGKGDEGFWDTTHSPHAKEDAQHEYILHTRAALASSPLVQEIVAEAVKAEREACAKEADYWASSVNILGPACGVPIIAMKSISLISGKIAASIRKRCAK